MIWSSPLKKIILWDKFCTKVRWPKWSLIRSSIETFLTIILTHLFFKLFILLENYPATSAAICNPISVYSRETKTLLILFSHVFEPIFRVRIRLTFFILWPIDFTSTETLVLPKLYSGLFTSIKTVLRIVLLDQ